MTLSPVHRLAPALGALSAGLWLAACGETATPTTPLPTEPGQASGAAGAAIERLPDALLGVVATEPAECTSTYGPLVIRPTEFDFGWGTARFQTIRRRGDGYAIRAEVTGEGQAEGPQMEDYVLGPATGGGLTLTMGEDAPRTYRPCTGRTSGVSVDEPPPGPEPVPPALPISPGVYVIPGTACATPPNAAFRIYDGVGLSGSATRACRTTVREKTGRSYQLDTSCEATYDGRRSTARQTFVEGADRFRLTEEGEGETPVTYERCPMEQVPAELRRIAEGG